MTASTSQTASRAMINAGVRFIRLKVNSGQCRALLTAFVSEGGTGLAVLRLGVSVHGPPGVGIGVLVL